MNDKQKERYSRHIKLQQIGETGQEKLLNAKVLVVGAGGLGAPILHYLAAAGIGTIGIVDADIISLSNLQRQILYRENQLGERKVDKAKGLLNALNSDVNVKTYPVILDESNADKIISEYDLVIGATDNFQSRICIDRSTKRQNKPFINGSICEYEGQVSVFNYKGGISYTELYPELPEEAAHSDGVMGVLPGIIGSIQACEAIKIILGQGHVLSNQLLVYNALEVSMNILKLGE